MLRGQLREHGGAEVLRARDRVAGGKKETTTSNGARAGSFGVLAWNNKNYRVLSDGKGIDLAESSPVFTALFGSIEGCEIVIPEGPPEE